MNKMAAEIILSEIRDLEKIVALNSQIFAGMYEHDPYDFEQYQSRLKNKQFFILSAWVNKQLVGDAISYVANDNLYLWIMGVGKNFRQQGIATQLLDHTEKIARENNLLQVSAKVYDVSPEMKSCLIARGYELLKIEESAVNKKYNANYYLLKVK